MHMCSPALLWWLQSNRTSGEPFFCILEIVGRSSVVDLLGVHYRWRYTPVIQNRAAVSLRYAVGQGQTDEPAIRKNPLHFAIFTVNLRLFRVRELRAAGLGWAFCCESSRICVSGASTIPLRMARVETLIRWGLPSTITRTVWRFGLIFHFDSGDIQTDAALILGATAVVDLAASGCTCTGEMTSASMGCSPRGIEDCRGCGLQQANACWGGSKSVIAAAQAPLGPSGGLGSPSDVLQRGFLLNRLSVEDIGDTGIFHVREVEHEIQHVAVDHSPRWLEHLAPWPVRECPGASGVNSRPAPSVRDAGACDDRILGLGEIAPSARCSTAAGGS